MNRDLLPAARVDLKAWGRRQSETVRQRVDQIAEQLKPYAKEDLTQEFIDYVTPVLAELEYHGA